MSLAKDLLAQVVDGVSFGFINTLQWRAKGGFNSREAFLSYIGEWEQASPEVYFAVPPDFPEPDLPDSGTWSHPSPHPTGCAANDHVHLEIWPGPKGWHSPTMFLLHGVMSVSDIGYRLWAKKLNSLGWSAIFFHLPYHYGRRPRGVLSGEMALTANLIRTSEGIRQAVIELRWICAALEKRGVPHIGLWATSYGGWIAGLLLGLESRISTAWLLEPIADVDHAVWESPAAITLRRQASARGIRRQDVARHLRLVCPSQCRPLLNPERILLVGGLFDRIAPVRSLRALHQAWPGSTYAEFRQGHVGYQLMPESLRMAQERFPALFSQP
jgi:pimeloyl-ACP methyl ester carboxylesterase